MASKTRCAPSSASGRRWPRAWRSPSGFCSTTSISSCTCSVPTAAPATASSGCGATRSGTSLPTKGRSSPSLFARSRVMRGLVQQARRYASVDATVLITGETGVGKDALARFIHGSGPRRKEPFVTVDCPALAETLVESELFGHERGAFTDATASRPGRFEMPGHGTLYLDAVTGLSPSAQGALLRVVEERRVTRLGGTIATDVRARFIASADAGIEDAVRDGALRAELFHRLSVLPVQIPPLRERPDDIMPFARMFVDKAAARMNRAAPAIDR